MLAVIRPFVDRGDLLTTVELYVDEDLGGQCVGARFGFSGGELFVHVEGMDDSICVTGSFPVVLSDESIRKALVPVEWASAIGCPILWAWAMTNTQGRIDGFQLELGAVDGPSIVLQFVARASMLVLREL